MNLNVLRESRNQFNSAVDAAIRECSRETGITDLETVYDYLKKKASRLLKRLIVVLAHEQVRIIIQKRLKRCTVSVAKAAKQAMKEAAQMEFDFFEMDQFRGMAQRITYPEDRKMKYVEYNRSTEVQRLASITHLDTGIAADIARREAEAAANAWLHPLVVRHGDLPAEELARLWLKEQQRGKAEA
jgi:hypothetical protein